MGPRWCVGYALVWYGVMAGVGIEIILPKLFCGVAEAKCEAKCGDV